MGLISYIFGDNFFMGNQFVILNNYSISIVFPNEISRYSIVLQKYIFETLILILGLPFF